MKLKVKKQRPNEILNENMPLAGQIASRLRRRYGWVPMDDLYSYSLLGLTMAANAFDVERGVPFSSYASQKGMFWAIDEMRKDGVLRRRSCSNLPKVLPFSEAAAPGRCDESWTPDVEDAHSDQDCRQVEARDLCRTLLRKLSSDDRQMLLMYYCDYMTFREIAKVFGISESSVCLRHKAALRRLRQMAKRMKVA